MFFDFEKNVKKRKKRTYSFTGHLITPGFNTQLRKVSTGKSPTSNILFRNADKRNQHLELCEIHARMFINGSEWITLGELGTELQ